LNNIIEVSDFTKRYGDFTAVDDISFTVEEGSIFAFLGPNGAGKSTTINTLCTILDGTSGSLRINGHDVSKEKTAVRGDIGIVFQEPTLDSRLTIEENLRYHCRFYGVAKGEEGERIDFAIGLVDLGDRRREFVGGLSGGLKRRVEIARALVHYPKVIFLDEPTAGLDPQARTAVWDYLKRLRTEKGITIFLTTHYMDEAEICSRVAVIDGGRIAAFGTPDELKIQFVLPTLRVATTKPREMGEFLARNGVVPEVGAGDVVVHTKDVGLEIELLFRFKDSITDFEADKGSLNDVFLAITKNGGNHR
jgi:ABC-2 type transport system ATP-binding protein